MVTILALSARWLIVMGWTYSIRSREGNDHFTPLPNLSIQAPANLETTGLLDGDFLYKILTLAKPLQPLEDNNENQRQLRISELEAFVEMVQFPFIDGDTETKAGNWLAQVHTPEPKMLMLARRESKTVLPILKDSLSES